MTERIDGVETVTESDDPAIVAKLQEHVAAMYKRVERPSPIRMRDPLFREIFRHTKQIEMKFETTDKGLRVTESSQDPYVATLIKAHAKVVSAFVARGFAEAQQMHPIPQADGAKQDAAKPETDGALSAAESAQRQAASAARDELAKRLSTRLTQAVSSGGPAKAITVCSKEAPRIAEIVGQEHGVKIGRTSFRLRNLRNEVPDWAISFVEQRVDKPTYASLPDGALGALLPIRVNAQCLTCHGPPARISAEVKSELAAHYPDDQATGFNDGDLRGWFGVEVPQSNTDNPNNP